jgi:hypothetical protein
MKGDVLPEASHVTRLCSYRQLNPNGLPDSSAFLHRPSEVFLSVNWLECLALKNRAEEVAEVLRVLRTKRSIGTLAQLALLHVGRSSTAVWAGTMPRFLIQYLHEPEIQPADPSHSGIYNIPRDDNTVAELLALSVETLYPTR